MWTRAIRKTNSAWKFLQMKKKTIKSDEQKKTEPKNKNKNKQKKHMESIQMIYVCNNNRSICKCFTLS